MNSHMRRRYARLVSDGLRSIKPIVIHGDRVVHTRVVANSTGSRPHAPHSERRVPTTRASSLETLEREVSMVLATDRPRAMRGNVAAMLDVVRQRTSIRARLHIYVNGDG